MAQRPALPRVSPPATSCARTFATTSRQASANTQRRLQPPRPAWSVQKRARAPSCAGASAAPRHGRCVSMGLAKRTPDVCRENVSDKLCCGDDKIYCGAVDCRLPGPQNCGECDRQCVAPKVCVDQGLGPYGFTCRCPDSVYSSCPPPGVVDPDTCECSECKVDTDCFPGSGDICCNKKCVSPGMDPNCGTCGNDCTAQGETCQQGQCTCGGIVCRTDQLCCNRACVDPTSDPNCVVCGNDCSAQGWTCGDGGCVTGGTGPSTCPGGCQCFPASSDSNALCCPPDCAPYRDECFCDDPAETIPAGCGLPC